MEKIAWSENSPDPSTPDPSTFAREGGGLDAARGLIIGLAVSQVFWLALALLLVRF
jgi:hypothetical protein